MEEKKIIKMEAQKEEVASEEASTEKKKEESLDFFTLFQKDYSLNILFLIEYQKVINTLNANLNTIKVREFKSILMEHFQMSRELFKKLVDNMRLQQETITKLREEWLKLKDLPKKTDTK